MNKKNPFTLTEWDWLKMQLQFYALKCRAEAFSFSFEFKEELDCVVCSMHGISIKEILRETTEKSVLFEEYFSSWTRSVKREVAKFLEALPVLRQDFDLEKNLEFEIMYDYGMGASLVCRIVGRDVFWDEYILNSFNQDSKNTSTDGDA